MALVVPAAGITFATVITSDNPTPTPRVAIARPVKLQPVPVPSGAVLGASTDAASAPVAPSPTARRIIPVRAVADVKAATQIQPVAPTPTPITITPPPSPSGAIYNPKLDLPSAEQISDTIKGGGTAADDQNLGQLIDGPIMLKPICNPTYPSSLAVPAAGTITDSWGMLNRESVSYAAYRVHQDYICGKNSHDMPTDWNLHKLGAASYWPQHATEAKLTVDAIAARGSILIDMKLTAIGFAMYVEQVKSDGSITVSDYDHDSTGLYAVQTLRDLSGASFIHFN